MGTKNGNGTIRSAGRWTAWAVAAGALGALCLTDGASAEVPKGPLTFSNPTVVTNPYFPVVQGSMKVFIGRDEGRTMAIVETVLPTTRDFVWNEEVVTCLVIQGVKFAGGELVETEKAFVAQADNGGVYAFGETEDGQSPDDEPGEKNGWIVGQVQPEDPADVVTGATPTLVLPANPEKGDTWLSENVPPEFVEHQEMKGTSARVRVPAARFLDLIRIRETTPGERGGETMWLARGVGVVKVFGYGKRLRLYGSTEGISSRRR